MAVCLETLGAPIWVWETSGGHPALAWGWLEERDLGVRISVPLADSASASFNYNDVDSRMQGLVLFFDSEMNLSATRRGLLSDFTEGGRRRRPALVADSDS